jgi:hypothetical protein
VAPFGKIDRIAFIHVDIAADTTEVPRPRAATVRSDLRATYRVQLREEFDFDAAAAIVPYL